MTDDLPEPRAGSSADLSRRVTKLEVGFDTLTKSVDSLGHNLDLVKLGQQHNAEMMAAKFSALEATAAATHNELRTLVGTITTAMNAAPEDASPQARALLQEYAAFKAEARGNIAENRAAIAELDRRKHKLREEFDDYVLVQTTKHEAQSSLMTRAFGGSVLGAISGLIGIALGALALAAVLANHPPQ